MSPSPTRPAMESAEVTAAPGAQDVASVFASPGVVDFQARERRAELLKLACELARLGRRLRRAHDAVFRFSMRRVLRGPGAAVKGGFAALENGLAAVAEESANIETELERGVLASLPRRAKTGARFRDALRQYAAALSSATDALGRICRGLRMQKEKVQGFSDYDGARFRGDRVRYDACLQDLHRSGTRLRELAKKI